MITVVGAGPVGLTAALALAQRGFPVTVLEAGEGLATESRASTFHPPTLELLDELGVLPELLHLGLVAPVFAYRDRRDGSAATFDLGLLKDDTRYPFRLQCEQSKLTPVLLRHFLSCAGATIRFGHRVEDPSTLTSEWVIGADGAHSAVRRGLGIIYPGITYPERYLVASTLEELTGLAYVNYVADPMEWLVLLRTPNHWRVLLPTAPGTSDEEELARLPQRLSRVCDFGRPWRIAHASVYRVHQRVATTFKQGNVLLAGDAAHVNNPLGGLGMNSGIHDAIAYARAFPDVEAVAAERRRIAIEVIQKASHRNWERVRDPERHLATMRAIAADPVRAREYMLHSSMLRHD